MIDIFMNAIISLTLTSLRLSQLAIKRNLNKSKRKEGIQKHRVLIKKNRKTQVKYI